MKFEFSVSDSRPVRTSLRIFFPAFALVAVLILTSCSGSAEVRDQNASVAGQEQGSLAAGFDPMHRFSEVITPEFLSHHLHIIAGDGFEGRGTGQPGIDRAAEYIAGFYRELGIPGIGDDQGGYFQHFTLAGQVTRSIEFSTWDISTSPEKLVWEGVFSAEAGAAKHPSMFTRLAGSAFDASAEIVFAGSGALDAARGVDHFDGVDVSGKWVMVFDEIRHFSEGDTLVNPDYSGTNRLRTILFQKGARGVILIRHFDEEGFLAEQSDYLRLLSNPTGLRLGDEPGGSRFQVGILGVHPGKAARLLGLGDVPGGLSEYFKRVSGDPAAFRPRVLPYRLTQRAESKAERIPVKNVAAVIEGSHPELKDEYVVLTAHYDHMGLEMPDESGDMIYNGADDNGSGTVALMAVGRALAEARDAGVHPKRSVILLHVTAEEVGLLGSRYYSDNPTVPIESIVANLNADMIGRIDDEMAEKGKTDYVYIIGGEIISSDMNRRLERANQAQGEVIELSKRYNDLNDRNQFYRRSDHWNFGRLGIPFIFYFTGVHDDYHRPGDTPDKILYDKYSNITRLIFSTTVEIANTPERPEVDSEEFIRITRSQPR